MIVALPKDRATASPPAKTPATVLSLVDQATVLPAMTLPCAFRTVAVSCYNLPTRRPADPRVAGTEAGVEGGASKAGSGARRGSQGAVSGHPRGRRAALL